MAHHMKAGKHLGGSKKLKVMGAGLGDGGETMGKHEKKHGDHAKREHAKSHGGKK